uniref:Uncharacterized protein n=1 Tax=Desulfovibrio sp. U5L TaxID=596152 RepID=I2PYZ3_9BACT
MPHPLRLRSARFWTVLGCALALWPACGLAAQAQQSIDPFGTCCVAKVAITGYNTWAATCGDCSSNPGTYPISQPDPDKLVFVGPGGVSADSPFDAATAVCKCPSEDALRASEKRMRTFDGQ